MSRLYEYRTPYGVLVVAERPPSRLFTLVLGIVDVVLFLLVVWQAGHVGVR